MRTTTKRSAQEAQLNDDGASSRLYKGKYRGAKRINAETMKNLRTKKNKQHLPSRAGDMLPRDMRGKFLNSIPTSLFRPGAGVAMDRDPRMQTDFSWETEESAVIAPANLYVQDPQIRRITEAALQRVNYAPMLQKWKQKQSNLEEQPILQKGRTWLTSDSASGAPFAPFDDGGTRTRHNSLGMFAAAKGGFAKNRGLSVLRSVWEQPTNRGKAWQSEQAYPTSYRQGLLASLASLSGLDVDVLSRAVGNGAPTPEMLHDLLAGMGMEARGAELEGFDEVDMHGTRLDTSSVYSFISEALDLFGAKAVGNFEDQLYKTHVSVEKYSVAEAVMTAVRKRGAEAMANQAAREAKTAEEKRELTYDEYQGGQGTAKQRANKMLAMKRFRLLMNSRSAAADGGGGEGGGGGRGGDGYYKRFAEWWFGKPQADTAEAKKDPADMTETKADNPEAKKETEEERESIIENLKKAYYSSIDMGTNDGTLGTVNEILQGRVPREKIDQ